MLASLKGLQTTSKQTRCRGSYLKPGVNWHWQMQWRNTVLNQNNNLPLLRETSYNFLWWALSIPSFSHTLKDCKSFGSTGRGRGTPSCLVACKEIHDAQPFWWGSQRTQDCYKTATTSPERLCTNTHTHKAKAQAGHEQLSPFKRGPARSDPCLKAQSCWAAWTKHALNYVNWASFI